jgi:hypothetical protein
MSVAHIGGVPAASISISPLGSALHSFLQSSSSVNVSALAQFQSMLNQQAVARDYLITFVTALSITTPNNIALQASTLAQFTAATNQLTRNTAVTYYPFHFSCIFDDTL